MKILHSADWHLDSPLVGRTEEQTRFLRQELLKVPDKIVSLCKAQGCSILLLSGDLFDGPYTKESFRAVSSALAEAGVDVFISPGNHDFCQPESPYVAEIWPENVHIFTHPVIESYYLESLNCRIYGAGYTDMDCPGLLKDFHPQEDARWHIGILHSDPQQAGSPYCPITTQQVRESNLDYLALGHIHKCGSFRSGKTLCAWPGCPMGRGYDELGDKGALLITLEQEVRAEFLPLDTPRFYDEALDVGNNPHEAVAAFLPPTQTQNFYRITLTGYASNVDTAAICSTFSHVPNLELRDRTLPEMDLWGVAGEDTLEGMYFQLLHDGLDTDSEKLKQHLMLAAKISRQILDGQEVILP